MSYDFDYYSGTDIRYPVKPTKPRLESKHTSIEATAYASALVDYERELESYNEDRTYYNEKMNNRQNELQAALIDEYGVTEAQFNVLWNKAYDRGHSAGLEETVSYFDEYYAMASEYASLEKD